ncbi:MAG TPA: type II secretion system F family protein, partial [Caulobacteraceae bacterium]|nr:type II secretion system F family protein [Caulobacteraceae bacterium]
MNWVDVLTNPDNILTVFTFVICFAAIVTVVRPIFQQNNLESRLKSVANRREELRRRSREAMAGRQPTLRQIDEGLAKRVVDRLQLSRLLEDSNLTDKLAQAGFRGPSAVSRFYFFRFVSPFLLAAAAAVYLFVFN